MCKGAQHEGGVADKEVPLRPSGQKDKFVQACAGVEMWRRGKRWMRAGCCKPRTAFQPPPPPPRKGPPVGIEWEVGCAAEADWTVGLSRET